MAISAIEPVAIVGRLAASEDELVTGIGVDPSTQTLGLFAKHWTAGKVKTRLAATVGDEKAAAIYRAFVKTYLQRFSISAHASVVYFTPEDSRSEFRDLASTEWRLELQSDGNLGDRMRDFFERELRGPQSRVVLLGTDSPNLPLSYIDEAFQLLERSRLVLGPTDDGGYYLIGARGEVPPVFDSSMPFSTPRLWEATLGRLAELRWGEGADYALLAPWYDVDTVDDLGRLKSELAIVCESLDKPLKQLSIFLQQL